MFDRLRPLFAHDRLSVPRCHRLMSSLTNKHIILGITGGIAAYKSAELCRLLIKAGAEVRVVMTQAAQEFITALTMQSLSGNRVHTQLLDTEAEAAMGHIELARWADLILVAPASANFMAQLAHGEAHDLLTTLCVASKSPLAIAPAMNQAMWSNVATQQNLQTLKQNGIHLFGPDAGEQARLLEEQREINRLVDELIAADDRRIASLKTTMTPPSHAPAASDEEISSSQDTPADNVPPRPGGRR